MTNERLRQSIEQLTKDTAAEWQAGYEAGVEAAVKALEADAKLCDCAALEDRECACDRVDGMSDTEPNPADVLAPCPFCGGEGEVSWYARGSDPTPAGHFIECTSCAASGEGFDIQGEMPDRVEYTKSKAVDAWNTRQQAQPTPDEWEVLAVGYQALSGKKYHMSDCATSCAPAHKPSICDCDAPIQSDAMRELLQRAYERIDEMERNSGHDYESDCTPEEETLLGQIKAALEDKHD